MPNVSQEHKVLETQIEEELKRIGNIPKKEQTGTHRITELLAMSELVAGNTRRELLMMAHESVGNSRKMLKKQDITNGRINVLEDQVGHIVSEEVVQRIKTVERHQGLNYKKLKVWEKHKEKFLWSTGTILALLTLIGTLRSAGIDIYNLAEKVEKAVITETRGQ